MDVQALHQFVASVPSTPGQVFARCLAVNALAAGSVKHAAALVGIVGPEVIPALVAAGAPPAMLRTAIQHAVLFRYREMPAFIEAHGGRAAFAGWCRRAAFTAPDELPGIVDLYRGTLGCSPSEAVKGLHWSLRFDDAAFYAARHADAALTGVIVVHARVPREGIAAFISGTAHQEVVPVEAPAVFEVIIDKERIGDAAVRNALRLQGLRDREGWKTIEICGTAARVATEARARMAEAGVPRGTAILA